MQLNHEGEVWKHCCQVWSDPNQELWISRDDGEVEIYCMLHSDCLLGYEKDLE